MGDYMSEARRLSFALSTSGLLVATLAGACGSVDNTKREPGVITTLLVSDAVAGMQGLIRVSFDNPVLQDTTLNLTATPSSIATIAGTATVLADSLSIDVPY